MMVESVTSIPYTIGAVILFAGLLMFIFPPKKINYLYGYRTARSMKNIENWNFAQKLSSKLLMIIGIVAIVTGMIGTIFSIDEVLLNTIGVIELIILMILLFVKTESDLRKFEKTV